MAEAAAATVAMSVEAEAKNEDGGNSPVLVYRMPYANDDDHDTNDKNEIEIKLHQVDDDETEQHNTGFVMWPSAVMLSRYITNNPSIVFQSDNGTDHNEGNGAAGGNDILELGAGCGLVGLTVAAMLKKKKEQRQGSTTTTTSTEGGDHTSPRRNRNVILTDYDPVVLENIKRNCILNGVQDYTKVAGLDFFDQGENVTTDVCEHVAASVAGDGEVDNDHWIELNNGIKQSQVSLILAADILCYSNDAVLVANTINAALKPNGGKAYLFSSNSNHRFGVEEFPTACRNAGLTIEVTNNITPLSSIMVNNNNGNATTPDSSNSKSLIHDLQNKSSGYVDENQVQDGKEGLGSGGLDFTMFTITK